MYFQPNITKEYIENKFSQEQLFYHFLHIEPKGKKLYKSPFRNETKPSCSFFRHNGELLLKDFGSGRVYNWISIVMYLYNLSYYEALNTTAKELGLVPSDKNGGTNLISIKKINPIKTSTTTCDIKVVVKNFTPEELKWWLQFGITPNILKRYNVASIQTVYINDVQAFSCTKNNPIYGYYFGKSQEADLWKIYMPLNPVIRFITNTNANFIQGLKQLQSSDFLVITKSYKDCMSLASLGISAVAPNSENLFIGEQYINSFIKKFGNEGKIIVFYDNDWAGKRGLVKIRNTYPNFNYIILPETYQVKDFSDFYKKYGKKESIQLIESYREYLQTKKTERGVCEEKRT